MCAPQTHTDPPTARPLQYSATDWTVETERGGVGGALGDRIRDSYSLKEIPPLPAMDVQSDLIPLEQANHLAGTNTQDIRGRKLPSPLSLSFSLLLFLSQPVSLVLIFFCLLFQINNNNNKLL